MEKQAIRNSKLGIFVIAGLLILVFSLYMIGRNKSFFGSKIEIKAQFRNVNGLMRGNNVRFSGIQAGTVKDIVLLNDTTIEVIMLVDKKTQSFIHKNSFASIGNEGLMGNKIINIEPNPAFAPAIEEGDMLLSSRETSMNDMLLTLDQTNLNASIIAAELLDAVRKINNSPVLWRVLNDTSLPGNLSASLANIHITSRHLKQSGAVLETMIADIRQGKGAAGVLLADPQAAGNVSDAISNIHTASIEAKILLSRLDSITAAMQNENSLAYKLSGDTAIAGSVSRSMVNIEKGTAAFNEDMEALKHNFLFRGYFKKQEKAKRRQLD